METQSVGIKPAFYFAVFIYESSSEAADYEPLYEESFVPIEADSEEEAKEKALRQVQKPFSYKNQYGETITWSFKQLVALLPVWNEISDGTELCSRFFQNYEAYRLTFLTHPAG